MVAQGKEIYISITTGSSKGLKYLASGKVTIGRDKCNDVVLSDDTVSSKHACIIFQSNGYLLGDLGSTNGTYYKNSKITEVLLQLGEEFKIGSTYLRLEAKHISEEYVKVEGGDIRRLANISMEAFVSDTDKTALQNLQKLPLLPKLVQKFNEYAVDRVFYVENTSQSVRCGPKQFPTLYRLLQEACYTLDVPEPELYLRYDPTYNAYTAGVNRTFIVLHSSLVEHFTKEELLFILGHELGHIKCGHVLYGMIGRLLIPLTEAIGQVTLGMGQLVGMGLVAGFYEWMRQAEYSGDRAGLLACQDFQVACSAIMKLGCGSTHLNSEMSVDTFLEQARNHAEMKNEGAAKALTFMLYTWQLDHPQVVYRAKGLDEWHKSGAYELILAGDYPRQSQQMDRKLSPQCPGCKSAVTFSKGDRFCINCGTDLQPLPSPSEHCCSSCNKPFLSDANFCMGCGTPVLRKV